jgi:septal ring factor EnvC (AmiA/AmiB activator)
MENPKIKKVEAEIDKTKAKIADFTAKLRELEKEKIRLENDDIVAAIRKAGLEKYLDRLNVYMSDADLSTLRNPQKQANPTGTTESDYTIKEDTLNAITEN